MNHLQVAGIFAAVFGDRYQVLLEGGFDEPLYTPPSDQGAGTLRYRADYAASALHESAHWLIAGPARRQQIDFGYWYESGARDAYKQSAFEAVEARPQALEWLLATAAGLPFRVSADNLCCEDLTILRQAVQAQALHLATRGLPARARRFADALAAVSGCTDYCSPGHYGELPS